MDERQIQTLVDVELQKGDKRSAVYRRGMLDVLFLRLNGTPLSSPHRPGTLEFDAWAAGIDRGHVLFRNLQEPIK